VNQFALYAFTRGLNDIETSQFFKKVWYNDLSEIKTKDLKRWLKKSREIQWDYKNIVKRKGKLERIK